MSYDYTKHGGVLLGKSMAGNDIWSFGWVPPADRTEEQRAAHDVAVGSMPKFSIQGNYRDVDKAVLWQFSKQVNGGNHFLVFNQKTGSCFVPGTPVRMADGTEKPIESVVIGDEVVTHKGRVRKVVSQFYKNFTGNLYTFEVAGMPFPVTVTDDHDCLVMEKKGWRWQPGELVKKRADQVLPDDRMMVGWGCGHGEDTILDLAVVSGVEVSADYIKLPRSKKSVNRFIQVNPDFGRLVGLYLAEGGHDSGRVTFSYHLNETQFVQETIALLDKSFGITAIVKVNEEHHQTNVVANSKTLAAAFSHLVPGNAYSKRLPDWVWSAAEETKIAVLRGWLDGDGHFAIKMVKSNHDGSRKPAIRIQGVTASVDLARDMTTLALSCGFVASCSKRKARKQSKAAYDVYISGRKALELSDDLRGLAEKHHVTLHENDTNRTEHGYMRKIKSIKVEQVTNVPVYCCEVEEDHSLLVNGLYQSQCVGNGGGQATWYLSAAQKVLAGDSIDAKLPFYLLPYGRSRFYLNGNRCERGEGSAGSAMAKALKEDGILPADTEGLPQPDTSDGITWGGRVEMEWSDGCDPARKWLDKSKAHCVKTTAQVRNSDEVKAALQNGYSVTIASDWGGEMQPSVQGNPGVLLNRHATTWNHQMCIIGYWNHPSLGEIFFILNSWGPRTFGDDPAGGPPGGFWVKKGDVDYITRQDDSFALSHFDGFVGRSIDWYM